MSFRSKLSRINLEINQAQIYLKKKRSIDIQAQVSVAKAKRVKCPSAELSQAWIHRDASIAWLFLSSKLS